MWFGEGAEPCGAFVFRAAVVEICDIAATLLGRVNDCRTPFSSSISMFFYETRF